MLSIVELLEGVQVQFAMPAIPTRFCMVDSVHHAHIIDETDMLIGGYCLFIIIVRFFFFFLR